MFLHCVTTKNCIALSQSDSGKFFHVCHLKIIETIDVQFVHLNPIVTVDVTSVVKDRSMSLLCKT